jgi:hypothetical protein
MLPIDINSLSLKVAISKLQWRPRHSPVAIRYNMLFLLIRSTVIQLKWNYSSSVDTSSIISIRMRNIPIL